MMGPHHLNEVFFDDVRVTEADVLGTGRRRAGRSCRRCWPSSGSASPATPAASGCCSARRRCSATSGTTCPPSCAAGGCAMLTHCRRARLLAYRVVALQSSGPGPARRRRGLPHRGDQARPGQRRGARRTSSALATLDGDAGPTGSSARSRTTGATSQASTVASGSIEMQRILLARSLLPAGTMNIDLSDEAPGVRAAGPPGVRGRRRRPPRPAGRGRPDRRESLVGPVLAELGAWDLDPRAEQRRARGRRRAVPQRRLLGASPTRWPNGCAVPTDLDVDGLLVVGRHASGRRGRRPRPALGRGDARRSPQPRHRLVGDGAAASRLRRPSSTSTAIDDDGARRRRARARAAVLDAARACSTAPSS